MDVGPLSVNFYVFKMKYNKDMTRLSDIACVIANPVFFFGATDIANPVVPFGCTTVRC